MMTDFPDPCEFLGKIITIKIDRPLGSRHPSEGFIYPVNYGFLEGIPAPDGEDLDAYILGVFEPMDEFTGKCIAIIKRTSDQDDKLVIVPIDRDFSDSQIMALIEFQERFFESVIVRDSPK
jgi:inorganic pyrophosphatase